MLRHTSTLRCFLALCLVNIQQVAAVESPGPLLASIDDPVVDEVNWLNQYIAEQRRSVPQLQAKPHKDDKSHHHSGNAKLGAKAPPAHSAEQNRKSLPEVLPNMAIYNKERINGHLNTSSATDAPPHHISTTSSVDWFQIATSTKSKASEGYTTSASTSDESDGVQIGSTLPSFDALPSFLPVPTPFRVWWPAPTTTTPSTTSTSELVPSTSYTTPENEGSASTSLALPTSSSTFDPSTSPTTSQSAFAGWFTFHTSWFDTTTESTPLGPNPWLKTMKGSYVFPRTRSGRHTHGFSHRSKKASNYFSTPGLPRSRHNAISTYKHSQTVSFKASPTPVAIDSISQTEKTTPTISSLKPIIPITSTSSSGTNFQSVTEPTAVSASGISSQVSNPTNENDLSSDETSGTSSSTPIIVSTLITVSDNGWKPTLIPPKSFRAHGSSRGERTFTHRRSSFNTLPTATYASVESTLSTSSSQTLISPTGTDAIIATGNTGLSPSLLSTSSDSSSFTPLIPQFTVTSRYQPPISSRIISSGRHLGVPSVVITSSPVPFILPSSTTEPWSESTFAPEIPTSIAFTTAKSNFNPLSSTSQIPFPSTTIPLNTFDVTTLSSGAASFTPSNVGSTFLPTYLITQGIETSAVSQTESPVTNTATSQNTATSTVLLPFQIGPQNTPKPDKSKKLVQIGFKYPLNYPFVAQHPDAAAQIFEYLPQGLSQGLDIDRGDVVMVRLDPYRNNAGEGPLSQAVAKFYTSRETVNEPLNNAAERPFLQTIAKFYIPKKDVNELQKEVADPNSSLYQDQSDSTVLALMRLIDTQIPVEGDYNSNTGVGGDNSGNGATSNSGGSSNGNSGSYPSYRGLSGAPGSLDQSTQPDMKASHANAKVAGITVGTIVGAGFLGSLLFGLGVIMRSRIQKRRHSNFPAKIPDMESYHDDMSSIWSRATPNVNGAAIPAAGTTLAAAAAVPHVPSAQSPPAISYPIVTENSLGWQ